MSGLRQIFLLVAKDLRLEWRNRSRVFSVALFGVVTLLLFSFAVGPDSEALRGGAAGFLMLALLLSSTLGLSESFRLENEDRALEGLLLVPASPTAVFYGKAIASALVLFLLAPVLAPVALVLYTLDLDARTILQLLGIWALASAGLAAPGSLYAAMTSRLRSQDVLLPLLLFPLLVPVLLAGVKAMALALTGDPMGQMGSWVNLLAAFVVVYWSLCGLLFPYALEEG